MDEPGTQVPRLLMEIHGLRLPSIAKVSLHRMQTESRTIPLTSKALRLMEFVQHELRFAGAFALKPEQGKTI